MERDEHYCILIPFPTVRRVTLVHSTAREILERDKLAGERHLRTTCNRIYSAMQVQGFDHSTIRQEVEDFVSAVRQAIGIDAAHLNETPGGAA